MEIRDMEITRRGRFWAVHDRHGQLVCVTVYQKGAKEVVRRLSLVPRSRHAPTRQEISRAAAETASAQKG